MWSFNIHNYEWDYIDASVYGDGTLPPGREQHVSVVYGNNIYIFGGKVNDLNNTIFGDFWRLNIESYKLISENFEENITSQMSQQKRNLYMINTTDKDDVYYDSDLDGGAMFDRDDARRGSCINELTVIVEFTHQCLQQLRISILGPGFLTGSPNFHAQSYENEVVLFDQRKVNTTACIKGHFKLIFDERSEVETNECCATDGVHIFRPEGRLSEFVSTTPRALWTLVIEDMLVDTFSGRLISWNIDFYLRPCNRRYTWTEVIPTSTIGYPPNRYLGHALVHDQFLFIFGGRGRGDTILNDLFRYNFLTNTWVELTPVNFDITLAVSSMVGYSLALTSWGLIRFGGYFRLPTMSVTAQSYSRSIYVLNPVTLHWKMVSFKESTVQPIGRYLTNIVFVPSKSIKWRSNFSYRLLYDQKVVSTHSNFAGSLTDSLFMFGGHNGASGSIKDGSSGGMLNDMWTMRLSNWSIPRFRDTQVAYQHGQCNQGVNRTSCFDSGSYDPCELRDLLLVAWCNNENQTIS